MTEPIQPIVEEADVAIASDERPPGSIWAGLGILLLLHLFQFLLVPFGGLLWIGVSQLLYVAPAAIFVASRCGRRTHIGLWIGAGITFLLNATCFGVFLIMLSQTGFH